MYFLGLAVDYDGTIAERDAVSAATLGALASVNRSGRALILVTGRRLPELQRVFPGFAIFDRIVAENGAVLFDPANDFERLLAPPPSADLVSRLRQRNIPQLDVGRSIIATVQPYENAILQIVEELGIEANIVFNRGAVMVLPPGINKATGLEAALLELDISPHGMVGVGDAQNDHAFLRFCGCGAAVANAVPSLKSQADVVLRGEAAAGTRELIAQLLARDAGLLPAGRRGLPVGIDRHGQHRLVEPQGGHVLVVGPSRSGKSTFATALTEAMVDQRYEFCLFDPEGDYSTLRHAAALGSADRQPDFAEVSEFLAAAQVNVVVHLHALWPDDRRRFMDALWPQIGALRRRAGRPNWLIIDEAHEAFPCAEGTGRVIPDDAPPSILLTVDPRCVNRATLERVDTVIAFGPEPGRLLADFAVAAGCVIALEGEGVKTGEALLWRRGSDENVTAIQPLQARQIHIRHAGKYAEGDVGPQRSFYFRGPQKSVNVAARNLFEFMNLGEALAPEIWTYHLANGDFTRWFRDVIRDEALACEAERLRLSAGVSVTQQQATLRQAILERYSPAA